MVLDAQRAGGAHELVPHLRPRGGARGHRRGRLPHGRADRRRGLDRARRPRRRHRASCARASRTTASSRSCSPATPTSRPRTAWRYGIKAVQWCADYGLPVMNTAIGGHASQEENESAFLANIEALAAAAEDAGVDVALEIHGDIMASGARSAAAARAHRPPAHQGRLRHGQLRVLRRRQGRRRHRRASSRTWPTCTSRTTAAARASGTSRSPATGRSTSAAVLAACSRRAATAARSRSRSSSRASPGRRSPRSTPSWQRACAHLNALGLG